MTTTSFFIIWLLCWFPLHLCFELPPATARSSGYDLNTNKISDILDEKLLPLKSEIHQIQRILDGDDSETAFPRFTQKRSGTTTQSSLPNFPPEIQNLGLNENALNSLSTLVSMFNNQDAVRSSVPPGTPTLTPDRLVDLLSSSLTQTSDLDKPKLEQLLNTWKNQMSNFPSFIHLPAPQQIGFPNMGTDQRYTGMLQPVSQYAMAQRPPGFMSPQPMMMPAMPGGFPLGSVVYQAPIQSPTF